MTAAADAATTCFTNARRVSCAILETESHEPLERPRELPVVPADVAVRPDDIEGAELYVALSGEELLERVIVRGVEDVERGVQSPGSKTERAADADVPHLQRRQLDLPLAPVLVYE